MGIQNANTHVLVTNYSPLPIYDLGKLFAYNIIAFMYSSLCYI